MARQSQKQFAQRIYQAGLNIGLPDHLARLASTQASLETGYGRSVKGNNYFGIKAGSSWKGPKQTFTTHEEYNGKRVKIKDAFRKYDSPEESLRDWAALMQRAYPDTWRSKNLNQAIAGLQNGKYGAYATDSGYSGKLNWINDNVVGGAPTQVASLDHPPPERPSALSAINAMAPNQQAAPALAYANSPPAGPPLPQRGAAENIADNLSLWDKIKLRKAPETFGAMGQGVAKIADGLGGAGLRVAQPAINAFEGMNAPTPPPRLEGLPQQTANQPFFPSFPTPPPGLQDATAAKAANMRPPTPIQPPMGLQNQTPNFLQQAQQSVRGTAPGLFNTIHDMRGQVDGVKIGLQNRARSDLRRALGNRPSMYVDPSETKRMGYQHGANGYIYGKNTQSGRFEQVGKREDGRDRLYEDVDLTKRKRTYNASTNKWEY